jgi:hypothetical protein
MATGRGDDWLFERAVRRADVVDRLVAEYAVSICGRPVRRSQARTDQPAGVLGKVTWTIDGDVVVQLTAVEKGRHEVVVYDVGLLHPLRTSLRSRHLRVSHRSRAVI